MFNFKILYIMKRLRKLFFGATFSLLSLTPFFLAAGPENGCAAGTKCKMLYTSCQNGNCISYEVPFDNMGTYPIDFGE